MHQVKAKPISAHASIALAAAIMERLVPAVEHLPNASSTLHRIIDELWRWQTAPRVQGRSTWTEYDARALPSGVLYWTHQARLVNLVGRYFDDARAREAIGGAIVSLTFAIWLIDKDERNANPEKPQVLGNDVAEFSWETLQLVLDTAVEGAADPAEMARWLTEVMDRLAIEHPRPRDPHDFGQPIPRNKFPGL
jgi:hypothetical protein